MNFSDLFTHPYLTSCSIPSVLVVFLWPDPVLTGHFLELIYYFIAAKEREKAEKAAKLAQQKRAAEASARVPSSSTPSSKKGGSGHGNGNGGSSAKKGGIVTPVRAKTAEQLDLAGLNLNLTEGARSPQEDVVPKVTMAREKVLEEAKKALESKDEKKGISMVVIGRNCFRHIIIVVER